MKLHPYWLLPAFLCACGSRSGSVSNANDDTQISSTGKYAAEAAAPMPAMPACYLYIAGPDSMMLRLRNLTPDGEISGELDYRVKKKDESTGSFFGKMTGDTLLANYSYLQKGKRKIREVAFVRRGDAWIEGSGPSAERSGIRRFTDPSSLTFGQSVYQKVPCW